MYVKVVKCKRIRVIAPLCRKFKQQGLSGSQDSPSIDPRLSTGRAKAKCYLFLMVLIYIYISICICMYFHPKYSSDGRCHKQRRHKNSQRHADDLKVETKHCVAST